MSREQGSVSSTLGFAENELLELERIEGLLDVRMKEARKRMRTRSVLRVRPISSPDAMVSIASKRLQLACFTTGTRCFQAMR